MLDGRISGAMVLVALVAISGALVAGCGGDSEASADVTRAEFVQEADAVCAERKKDWDAAAAAYTKENAAAVENGVSFPEQRKRTEAFFEESLLPLLQAELQELEDLEVPAADEKKVSKMLSSRSQDIEKLEEEGVEIVASGKVFKTFEKEAEALGIDCAMA